MTPAPAHSPARGPHRLPAAAVPHARIDRDTALSFELAGRTLTGHPGDTLASAALGAGLVRCGDSLYRNRPRGIMAAGVEEPNALVTVAARRPGEVDESMLTAITVELIEGLRADWVSGQGVLDPRTDEAEYDHVHIHSDVLVVGAGPAGLAAALAAARTGARVVLADDQPEPGGALLSTREERVAGRPAADWISATVDEFDAAPESTRLQRTSAAGSYDSNHVVAVERRTDHLAGPVPAGVSRERVHHIRARQVVLATGAHERPIVFRGNDRPGIVLAGAARAYLNRWGVAVGHRVVVATTNDSAYATAADLHAAGVEVVALVDSRPTASPAAARVSAALGLPVHLRSAVTDTAGDADGHLSGVSVHALDDSGDPVGELLAFDADALAVSGGWSPAVHLHSQRGPVEWDPRLAAFVPSTPVRDQHLAGALRGTLDTAAAVAEGAKSGARAAAAAGFAAEATVGSDVGAPQSDTAAAADAPESDATGTPDQDTASVRPLWLVPAGPANPAGPFNPTAGGDFDPADLDEHFVDLQRDQTVADILRATGAGMRSVEHIKRYTSIGTAHDQGRTSGLAAIGVIAQIIGVDGPGEIGTTRFRAPATPVSFAALAGRRRGELFEPARVTSIHPWHVAHGAEFEDVGQWKRPRYFPRPGEDMDAAVLRECAAVRESVGFMDASTLGTIDVRGTDAAEFLNRIYTNGYTKLGIGRARYGVMCTPGGMIFDDGTVFRIAADHFVLTTTTGGAAAVLDWLEEWLQTEWPELDVVCTSVTEQLATVAVVGPQSRAVVGALAPDLDVSREAFPFMAIADTVLAGGIPARVCRISFSGELAFELNVEAWHGLALWDAVAQAGAEFDITPYGTETMHVLRAEKGFIIVGQDTDGTVTPQDAGMEWIVSTKKDFIGKRSYSRADNLREDRKQLVAVLPVDRSLELTEGAQLITAGREIPPGVRSGAGTVSPEAHPVPMEGHVTSAYRSAALERTFGLALVKNGRARIGETLQAYHDGRLAEVVVAEPVLYDPAGSRRDGEEQPGSGRSDRRDSVLDLDRRPRNVRRSPLAHLADVLAQTEAAAGGAAGVRLREVPFLTMVGIRVRPGSAGARAIETAAGLPLPATVGRVTGTAPEAAGVSLTSGTSGAGSAPEAAGVSLTSGTSEAGSIPEAAGAVAGSGPAGTARGAEHWARASGMAMIWLAPDEFLAVAGPDQPVAEVLRTALGEAPGSVVELSANRTVIELVGPQARQVLQKGCHVDLHPRAFPVGAAVSTLLGPVQLIVWRTGEDRYWLMPRSSFADYLAGWLLDAVREFNPTPEGA